MRPLFFPLAARRDDLRSGALSRAIPLQLADGFREAGIEAAFLPWLVERGERLAWVLPETEIPREVVVAETSRAAADIAFVGEIGRSEGRFELRLRSETLAPGAPDGFQFQSSGSWEEAPAELRRLARELATWAHIVTDAGASRWSTESAEALARLLLDRDSEEYAAIAGVDALSAPRDRWRCLAGAVAADPDWRWPRDLLLARIEAWEQSGDLRSALGARLAIAEFEPPDLSGWRALLALAERAGEAGEATRAREQVSRLEESQVPPPDNRAGLR